MNNILISRYKNRILCMYTQGSKISDIQLYADDEIHVKSVYIGKVKNIVKNIKAAFVEVCPGVICFLSLDDIKYLNILNRQSDGKTLKQGDEIVVQISKGAVKSKAAVCTGKIKLPKATVERILKIAPTRTLYSVLYCSTPEYLSFFDRIDLSMVEKITCENADLFAEVKNYIDERYSDCSILIALYNDDYPVNKLYKVDSCIAELTNKTVWLESGANIVIEYTEAMTVIDVNSSKSINAKEADCLLNINLEAADEIFRQIKNRNLSGMILIDFINDSENNTSRLIDFVIEKCKQDPIGCNYIDITGLGIIEITRAKKYRPIYEMI